MDQLIRAWSSWLAGHPAGSDSLWGISIVGWGRAGKLLEFTAGLVILVDVIGPERIRRWGLSLRRSSPRDALRIVRAGVVWIPPLVHYLRSADDDEEVEQALKVLMRYPAAWVNFGLSFALLVYAVVANLIPPIENPFIGFAVVFTGWSFGAMIVLPVVIVVLFLLAAICEWILSWPVIAISSLLTWQKNVMAFKVVSVVLLAVGFHFDLLSV
jgi:hypothetical protein